MFMEVKTRSIYFDSFKCFLIFMVIWGHLLTPFKSGNLYMQACENFLYTFHMPLFVFISGYFSTIDYSKVKKHVSRLIETYLVCQIISSFFTYIISGTYSLFSLINPYCLYWYLWCLIFWKAGLFLIFKFKEKFDISISSILIILIIICLFIGYLPFTAFALNRFFTFFPFFILGYIIKIHDFKAKLHINSIIAIIILISYLLILIYLRDINFSNVFRCNFKYEGGMYTIGNRFLALIVSLVISLCVSSIPLATKYLAKIGKESLYIYVYHWWIIEIVLRTNIRQYFEGNLVFSVLTALAFLFLSYFLSKLYFFRWILNPLSSNISN